MAGRRGRPTSSSSTAATWGRRAHATRSWRAGPSADTMACRGPGARARLRAPRPTAHATSPEVASHDQADEVHARRGSHPARLVQHRGGPAGRARAGPPSRDGPADRPRRPGAALPDGAHRAGREHRARDRDPGAGARRLRALSAVAALPRASTRGRARYAGPHLLQVRRRQPVRQPQAQHRPGAGVLQQGRGRDQAGDRDRRRSVGQRARVRRRHVRPRGQGLHGPRELRPEAVPPQPHGDLWGPDRAQPEPGHGVRSQGAGRDAGPHGFAGHRHQRGHRGHRDPSGHEVLAGIGLRLRAPAPDGHRPGDDPPDGDGRRGAGGHHRLRRRRLELRRAVLSRGSAGPSGAARPTGSSPSSPRLRRA